MVVYNNLMETEWAWRYYWGGDVCGATLKPLHLHNPSTSVGNMEVADSLENV